MSVARQMGRDFGEPADAVRRPAEAGRGGEQRTRHHPVPDQEQAVRDLALADERLTVGEPASGGGYIDDAGLHVPTLA